MRKIDLSKCMTLKNHQLAIEIEVGEMEEDEDEKYFIGYASYTKDLRSLHNAILTGSESLTHCCITLASGKRHLCTVGDYLRFYDTYTRVEI